MIPGYYWIKYKTKDVIGYWNGSDWEISSVKEKVLSQDVTDISEHVITKEQYDLEKAGYQMLDAFRKAAIAYDNFIKLFKNGR